MSEKQDWTGEIENAREALFDTRAPFTPWVATAVDIALLQWNRGRATALAREVQQEIRHQASAKGGQA